MSGLEVFCSSLCSPYDENCTGLYSRSFTLIGGGALVAQHKLEETKDIDLAIGYPLFPRLVRELMTKQIIGKNTIDVKQQDLLDFNIGNIWYEVFTTRALYKVFGPSISITMPLTIGASVVLMRPSRLVIQDYRQLISDHDTYLRELRLDRYECYRTRVIALEQEQGTSAPFAPLSSDPSNTTRYRNL